MLIRFLSHAAILVGLALATTPPAHAQEYVYSPADTLAAMETHSPLANCIVRYEVGGVGYDPYAVGQAGELGVAQLHPYGMLSVFYARGYDNPYSPYQAMDFLEDALWRGEGYNWSPYWRCT